MDGSQAAAFTVEALEDLLDKAGSDAQTTTVSRSLGFSQKLDISNAKLDWKHCLLKVKASRSC